MDQVKLRSSRLLQKLAQKTSVSRVVFDEQDSDRADAHLSASSDGSLTTVTQKSSMDLTTRMNCSRSTGLVT